MRQRSVVLWPILWAVSCVPASVPLPFPATYLREPPPPEVVVRNYEDGTVIRRVWISRISIDNADAARQRLLASIECPDYRLLEEGKGTSVWRGVTTDYLLVRYRCQSHGVAVQAGGK